MVGYVRLVVHDLLIHVKRSKLQREFWVDIKHDIRMDGALLSVLRWGDCRSEQLEYKRFD